MYCVLSQSSTNSAQLHTKLIGGHTIFNTTFRLQTRPFITFSLLILPILTLRLFVCLSPAGGSGGARGAHTVSPDHPSPEDADRPDSDAYDQETDVDTDTEEAERSAQPGPSSGAPPPPADDSLELDCDLCEWRGIAGSVRDLSRAFFEFECISDVRIMILDILMWVRRRVSHF